ncbi:NADH-quinone oxidoreductase subunit C [Dyadobacter sp. CY345]|uniref:NADH-quinone oxidoreductase subunit C n=1 Tax=Dyadobacter sp. CY345 TaxID=2909335 RepID=UPI001F27768C|nr:NADH-quinone oxidoreductase subunit C [Dyadobacter sp. CY345]MCF2444902.1 NADH-quinone oxidoreductase subunit C [Dyadobacter sp. CY345]
MTFEEIKQILITQFGENIVSEEKGPQPILTAPAEKIADLCKFLFEDERLYFDFLQSMSALDNGPVLATMELVYNMTSIPYGHNLMIKIAFPRNAADEPLPNIPTVSHIWRTADWHEREAFDLMGINFVNHPDMRRILLPEDWEGNPLRKDYQAQEEYHGIHVRSENV